MVDLPFLTNSQIEELDSFGYIEVTEDLIEDLMNWCRNPEKINRFDHTILYKN
jgi:hypothetical protein